LITTTLGPNYDPQSNQVSFRVYSKNASRMRIYFYTSPFGVDESLIKDLNRDHDVWSISLSLDELKNAGLGSGCIYYGYRAWGPNWEYRDDWEKGSGAGFGCDVDTRGNRFNPNKLLVDPYARELSHDPQVAKIYIDPNVYIDDYYGGEYRNIDTGKIAPKSILVLEKDLMDYGIKPKRLLKDDVIYEVNLRGWTMLDDRIPQPERGTFKGAAQKAGYLKELGVTAVEFLPVQEFADAQNDDGDPRGDNFWGYMTVNYFSPNRRYSSDQSPGGPTREFKAMVKSFHDQGIKVFLDVVYNHTGEGLLKRKTCQGNPVSREEIEKAIREAHRSRDNDSLQDFEAACYLSFTGLDNQSYYFLRDGNRRYEGRGKCGGNLNYDQAVVQNLFMDSLTYWVHEMGVDGFRFDLAPVLSLTGAQGNCSPDPDTQIFEEISRRLPSRSNSVDEGVDLIAEPWGDESNLGWINKFPGDWSVWNERYRDIFKTAINRYGVSFLPVSEIAKAVSGSREFIGREPWNSINYLVSHDDCNSLRNIFSHNQFFHLNEADKKNDQISWDQGGDREMQRKAVRNAFALLMMSAGVPMFIGGDELFRAIPPYDNSIGKMNLVSMDSPEAYVDFSKYNELKNYLEAGEVDAANRLIETSDELYTFLFVKNLIRFRNQNASLRPSRYFSGEIDPQTGLRDLAWYKEDGEEFKARDWDSCDFIAYRIKAQAENIQNSGDRVDSIYIAYNRSPGKRRILFPPNITGKRWYRVLDTDNSGGWMTEHRNFDGGGKLLGSDYLLHERSVLVLVEK
jgi:isoamylase